MLVVRVTSFPKFVGFLLFCLLTLGCNFPCVSVIIFKFEHCCLNFIDFKQQCSNLNMIAIAMLVKCKLEARTVFQLIICNPGACYIKLKSLSNRESMKGFYYFPRVASQFIFSDKNISHSNMDQ